MSESARTEQILTQFQLKTLQTILTSRIPHLSLSDQDPITRTRKRDRWFNLALPDLPPNLHHSPNQPLILDVIISPGDVIAEQWSLTVEPPLAAADGRRFYKKSIVLLRSLYSLLRLLPCFKIFKLLSSSNFSYDRDLSFRISSFAAPFSREEDAAMDRHVFAPIETQFGCLSLSVSYRASLDEFRFEAVTLIPPTIIADYVGSPIADPMREFPSSPALKRSESVRGASNSAAAAFQRPHSWSEVRLVPKVSGSLRKGNFCFEEFRMSPPPQPMSSNSPTPSPPAYGSGGSSLQGRMRLETAPVSIPVGMRIQVNRPMNHSDLMRSFLPPPSPRSVSTTRLEHSSSQQELSPSSEGRSFRKSEGLKLGDFYSNLLTAQKGLKDGKDGKDDSGRFSGIFSSSGSPRFGFSRSSSRLSIQDDLDDCDFSCPFAVDDVDTSDSQTRNLEGKEVPESQSYTSSHKSQDAAVGVLVHMLRTAAPLRQDHSYSSQSSRSELNGEVSNSSFFVSRKTSDALEELRTYKEMKEILLSQSRSHLMDSVKRTAEEC